MSLEDLDLVKLTKLISEYTDQVKCIECCKYFVVPSTAACGHSLCHACWLGRRTCPQCACPLDRKLLKMNLPLQNLTNHIQKLGAEFEKFFNVQLIVRRRLDENRQRLKKRLLYRHIRDTSDPFDVPSSSFVKLYRLSKETVHYIIQVLQNDIPGQRRHGIPIHIKVLATLHFLGHGGYQTTVGHGVYLGLCQSSVSKCLEEVTTASNEVILVFNVKFPGSSHDSAVWHGSILSGVLEDAYIQGTTEEWLLGDSGYAQMPWLMTPYSSVDDNTPEARYNVAHVNTRVVIERCFGLMKTRFRCLHRHRTLHYDPVKASQIIASVATLHNLGLHRNDPLPEELVYDFSLDTIEEIGSEKDPVKNVKEWLTSSQNHFSAPLQSSETCSQDIEQPCNPLEISSSNIIIHTDTKKNTSTSKVAKMIHLPPPQDDWDKIEAMPDVEQNPRNKENVVGPMDIEPLSVDDSEYTTNNPRRSARKKDIKLDNSNQKINDPPSNKPNSRDSSYENDKKSQKSKQTWNNVKRMKKEFSKLNKKNRSKLNFSIEMVKKAQNLKSVSTTPLIATQNVINIDENTPDNIDKENEMIIANSNDHIDKQPTNLYKNTGENPNKSSAVQLPVESLEPKSDNTTIKTVSNNFKNSTEKNVSSNTTKNKISSQELDPFCKTNPDMETETRMPFIKKGALCPKTIKVTSDDVLNIPEQEISGNSDDIEISIKVGNTVTNIVIKKKNDVQVKINSDREVQTSLGPYNLDLNQKSEKNNAVHNTDISSVTVEHNNQEVGKTVSKTATTVVEADKSISGKKNTASADTGTAQFEITESVEKELSHIMEYETADGQKETCKNIITASKEQQVDTAVPVQENLENLDELHDLDIFSGSVKEGNVQVVQELLHSEKAASAVFKNSKTQRNTGKRHRESPEEELLPKNKKVKVATQQTVQNKSALDSEPNYDVIMGQVFASIDADIEDIRKSQNIQSIIVTDDNLIKADELKNDDISQMPNKHISTHITQVNSHLSLPITETQKSNKLPENINEKHSENIFSILEKDDDHLEATKNDKMPQVEELLTPVLCQNLESSQECQEATQKTNKSLRNSQIDDTDKSIVEETPQKEFSFPKVKRTTSNLSQVTLSETKKLSSKRSRNSIISLTDTERESTESNKDMTIAHLGGKKLTLETPTTISKFANHIIHKSTPVAKKSLNFDNEDEENDPEQTICPTSEVIAKTTQEKEIMSKAFENTPKTPTARSLMVGKILQANIKYCLVASRLKSDEILKVKLVCAQQKWRYLDNYSKDITHLVVSVDEENKSQRSVKYMCALADSKWIVSFGWIEQCLRTKNIVDEECFEALDSFGEPGPRRSRLAKQKLFQGIKFYCMPPFSVLDVVTLKNMLMSAGGCIVKDIKDVQVTKDSSQPALLLAEPENTQEDRFIYLAMERSVVPVNFEWVLNCLGNYSLGSIQDLLLCPSALLPAATASWPDVLLAQDYE